MKRMERDYVYSLICELAEQAGLDVRDYADQLYAERGLDNANELPSEIIDELIEARRTKREQKDLINEQEKLDGDIKLFRELFPEVNADAIPIEVWENVGKGMSLTAAYAIYQRRMDVLGKRAEALNVELEKTTPIGLSESEGETFVSSGEVENMSPSEIKKNYKKILLSLKKWN
ncbi:MAG: hypothetical protein J6L23_02575 [Clostridia bacterium]|nr:hypothetical protein [Clostridia bacterium]